MWGQSNVYTSNVDLTTKNGSSASAAIVHCNSNDDGYAAIKLGTGSASGYAYITVPANTTKLHIHCAGWKNDGTNRKLNLTTTATGVTISPSSMSLTNDDGISSNSPFILNTPANASTSYYASFTLSGVTSNTQIKLATSSKRAVYWGINAEIPISSIAFSEPKTAIVAVGGSSTLTPTILPINYTETVDWESDNTSVATVSSAGVVTGVAAGTAHITAKSHGNPSTIYDVCTVTVTAPVAVTGISMKASTTLLMGETETLVPTISPTEATNQNVTWSSSDATKVSVENGVITALALTNGTPVNITVTTADGGFTATCAVTVDPIPVSSIGLNKASATLRINKTVQLEATVNPSNATDKTVSWESDDTNIATVSSTGLVTAKAVGNATITVKSNADNTKTATCAITVNDGAIELAPGEVLTFNDFSGAGTGGYKTQNCDLTASDGNAYEWSETRAYSNSGWQLEASNGVVTSPSIKTNYGFTVTATMSANSVVISDGTNEGTNSLTSSKTNTTISISSTSKFARISSITITALKQDIATGVSITDPGTLAKGATGTFAATSTDAAACTKAWTSSDANVIEITNATTGAYEAKGRGTAKITYTITPEDATNYKAVTAELNVSVTEPVVITANDVTMTYGDAAKSIGATTSTGYAGTLTYESGNTNIATVDATGKVTAVATGTTTITISAPADAEHLYTAGVDIVINVTVSAPTGGTTAAEYTQNADDYEALTSAATGWTYTNWTTHSTYGACSTAGTAGQLITKNYVIPNKANPVVFFEHTGKTFDDPSEACKLYVQEGSATPVELTIPTYFEGQDYDNPYIESGDIDISAYIGRTVHFIFDYNPSDGNDGKWEVKNFGIYYDIFGVKLNSAGYATYCSEYPLDFTDADGYTAWYISNVDTDNKITFTQITGGIKGGQGILLKGTANATVTLTSDDSETVLSNNKFEGTLAPKYIANGQYYGLSGDGFVKVNSGTVPAGKALIPATLVNENLLIDGARLTFVFEDATGISTIEHSPMTIEDGVYNLSGQCVDNPKKGLYIINGKKVVIK